MKLSWNILSTLSARIALLGVALASSVILARVLGPEGRGLFALVLLLPEMARSFSLFGFEQANTVYAGLSPGGRGSLFWQSAIIAVVLGGGIVIGSVVYVSHGAPGFPGLVKGPYWMYALTFATLPLGMLMEYWGAILRGINRIFLLNVVEVASKIGSLVLLIFFLLFLRHGVAGAVWANFLGYLSGVLVLLVILIFVNVAGRPQLDWLLWKRTARFALPAHGGTIAAYLNYRVDEVFIAVLLPPEQLGFYAIAVGLVERIWIVPGAVATALLPHLTNAKDRDLRTAAVVTRHVILWVGAGCLAVFALSGIIVPFLYGSSFSPAVAALRWLLPGIFTLSIGKVLVAELLAQEKPLYTVWASGSAAVVNVVANLLLVPLMGISGASLASSISYTLLSFILIWCYLRETGVSWKELVPRRSDLAVYVAPLSRMKSTEVL